MLLLEVSGTESFKVDQLGPLLNTQIFKLSTFKNAVFFFTTITLLTHGGDICFELPCEWFWCWCDFLHLIVKLLVGAADSRGWTRPLRNPLTCCKFTVTYLKKNNPRTFELLKAISPQLSGPKGYGCSSGCPMFKRRIYVLQSCQKIFAGLLSFFSAGGARCVIFPWIRAPRFNLLLSCLFWKFFFATLMVSSVTIIIDSNIGACFPF